MVILTGGFHWTEETDATSIVSIYDQNGWRKDLPSLQQERKHHGCGSYKDDENNIVSKQSKHLHVFFSCSTSMYPSAYQSFIMYSNILDTVYLQAISSISSCKSNSRIMNDCLSVHQSFSHSLDCTKD